MAGHDEERPPLASASWRAPWVGQALLCLLGLLLVLPFADKPPHIDEESYVFIGHALQAHWGTPYHWWRAWQPTWTATEHSYLYAHPPFFLWWSALTEWLCGDNLVGRRLCALPFVFGLTLGIAGLARAFLSPSASQRSLGPSLLDPTPWTLVLLTGPCLLLILHQSLMPDLPWLCFIMLACAQGVRAPRHVQGLSWPHIRAGLLLGVAAWIKYPALVLLPLGFVFPGATRASAFGWMAGALAVVLPGELWLRSIYGTSHLLHVLTTSPQIDHTSGVARALGMLTQLGFCALGPGVILRFWSRDATRAARASLMAVLVGGVSWILARQAGDRSDVLGFWVIWAELEPSFPPVTPAWTLGVLLACALGGALLSAMRLRSPEDRFLTSWALLAMGAVLVGHNFSSTRYLGPAVVPLGLLLGRALRRGGGLGFPFGWKERGAQAVWGLGLALSLGLAQADRALALAYPTLGTQVAQEIEQLRVPGTTVWFRGEWGFRAELEARGYRTLPPGVWPAPGDILVWAELAGSGRLLPELKLERERMLEGPWARLRVMWPGRAGFYASVLGILPFSWFPGPLERVGLGRVPVRPDSEAPNPGEGRVH